MKKIIGPSFENELIAYGAANNIQIIGQHFSWSTDALEFFYDTPPLVVAAVEAVYSAHIPTNGIPYAEITAEISAIELTISPRRIREAVLGIDGGWLAEENEKINALRATLKAPQ